MVRQRRNLLIEKSERVSIQKIACFSRPVWDRGHGKLASIATRGHGLCLPGDPDSDPIKERARSFTRTHIGSPPRENDEYGLECILGEVVIVDHSATDRQHEWSVPTHQFRERSLVSDCNEPGEQLAIFLGGLLNRSPGLGD
jgi:hypothetical protein